MSSTRGAGGASAAEARPLHAWPVFQCGFRPFFVATAGTGAVAVALWAGFLAGWLALPPLAGGPIAWHAHELLLGMGFAAVAGFVLTAVPEFTSTPAFAPRIVWRLAALWLLARAAVLAWALVGPWPLLLAQTALAGALAALVLPRLWRDPTRRQRGFALGIGAACAASVVAEADLLLAGSTAGLQLLLHALLALTVLALARISMRIVNQALVDRGEPATYLARPPRRQLAIGAIALHALAQWTAPESALAGWAALAAAAALLGLLADWHLPGRAAAVLARRWVAILYAVPWLMAGGYALRGLAALGAPVAASAGLHLHTVGALALAMFAVLNIAGRTHAGLRLDERRWLPWAAAALVAAALVRAAAGLWPALAALAWQASAALWAAAFVAWLWHGAPALLRTRADGRTGCQGVALDDDDAATAGRPPASTRAGTAESPSAAH